MSGGEGWEENQRNNDLFIANSPPSHPTPINPQRLALPNSRVMIHQPMGGARGQAEDIKVEASQIMKIRDNLVRIYSMQTGQTEEAVKKDLDRDKFMSAEEAKEYGIIDQVIELNED